ncbi:PAN domain-containing protein [Aspergillus novofumigatus IBT 16806]|uniref:Apple domain-containing protein n=1 Tax=Aspergillus novofumigatus (strain IBT 16806) TaxID=1392255 RepID=A0A2I1BTK7_ASPN1|nr:uncharacterized protein P174DRAFT_446165 [Aspergillus novofumigatus IBT 16806]PKX88631.1 hypothetical protein P174DRAFT_446165 [Aspergillus novofumigatus IBT 16806]
MAPSTLSKLLLLPLTFWLVNAACPAALTAAPAQPEVVGALDEAVCPEDHSKAVVGADGTHYLLQCCAKRSTGATYLGQSSSVPSKRGCLERCEKVDKCNSVEYDNDSKTCVFFDGPNFSTEEAGGPTHDWLYFIDPPAQPAVHNITHMCSTDCPAAHGQKYVSEYGELFHMECGKRHGTVPFREEEKLTYRDCLDGCAKLPKCLSVDWSSRTKMCYYGTHSGAAPVSAPAYNSAYSFGCAGACEKDMKEACGCGGRSTPVTA